VIRLAALASRGTGYLGIVETDAGYECFIRSRKRGYRAVIQLAQADYPDPVRLAVVLGRFLPPDAFFRPAVLIEETSPAVLARVMARRHGT
jgi:hypothetical protein